MLPSPALGLYHAVWAESQGCQSRQECWQTPVPRDLGRGKLGALARARGGRDSLPVPTTIANSARASGHSSVHSLAPNSTGAVSNITVACSSATSALGQSAVSISTRGCRAAASFCLTKPTTWASSDASRAWALAPPPA